MIWQDYYDWYLRDGPSQEDGLDEAMMRLGHHMSEVVWTMEDRLLPVLRTTLDAFREMEATLR